MPDESGGNAPGADPTPVGRAGGGTTLPPLGTVPSPEEPGGNAAGAPTDGKLGGGTFPGNPSPLFAGNAGTLVGKGGGTAEP